MFNAKYALEKTLKKIERTSQRIKDTMPNYSVNGIYNDESEKNLRLWTNGFWSGILWHCYKLTGIERYAEYAVSCEQRLDEVLLDFYEVDHDAGFMWLLTSVAHYSIKKDDNARRRALIAASLLASRFNAAGGYIRAWNDKHGEAGYAIVDCMMNLPLLYWASQELDDPRFRHIAMRHANTAMKYQVLLDGSTRHILNFDAETGKYINNLGGQGYSEDSCWSRGNSWALYGFALSYHYTGKKEYLKTAVKIADYFISNLPKDFVPFADFKAPPEENIHKDATAAAIASCGLILIHRQLGTANGAVYRQTAEYIVKSLFENYTDWDNDEAIIQHGCVAYHAKGMRSDIPLIYGDYFFLEALVMLGGGDGMF